MFWMQEDMAERSITLATSIAESVHVNIAGNIDSPAPQTTAKAFTHLNKSPPLPSLFTRTTTYIIIIL